MAFREIKRSAHQLAVDLFMRLGRQRVPLKPTDQLTDDERILRAKLMVEEVLETCNGLGVRVKFWELPLNRGYCISKEQEKTEPQHGTAIHPHDFSIVGPLNIVEAVDGCLDVRVVTTGTLSAMGVSDEIPQEAVDQNNLDKFGPGCTIRADGKVIKPPNHQPPDILSLLEAQGYVAGEGAPN